MTKVQFSIIEKVKKELDIVEDISSFELHNLLFATRNSYHPDKFTEEESKKIAEEKFKTLNNLLLELASYIEKEKLTKKATEISIYEEGYKNIEANIKIINLENEVKILNLKNQTLEHTIEKLEQEITEKQNNNLINSQNELIDIYKPKKNTLLIFSLTSVFIVVVNIISNLNSIKEQIINISPIEPKYINLILFLILIFILLDMGLKSIKRKKVKKISDILISPSTIKYFHNYYAKEHEYNKYFKRKYFTESDVLEFIEYKHIRIKYTLSNKYHLSNLFAIKDYDSINHLKDIFIYNLISKKLIKIGNTNNLERQFDII